jgi:membrane-associated phospholipid phosphatase
MGETTLTRAGAAVLARWRSCPWLMPGALLLLLAALAADVLTGGPLTALDGRIRSAVLGQAASVSWGLAGSRGATSLPRLLVGMASPHVAVPVLAGVAVVLAVCRRSLRPLFAAAIGVALLLGTVLSAKMLVGRVTPGEDTLAPGQLGAFPSGHTTTASVCYGLVLLLLSQGARGPARQAALAGAITVGFGVGAALVWCDLHWFTDVLAGWLLAALLVRFTLWLTAPRPIRAW